MDTPPSQLLIEVLDALDRSQSVEDLKQTALDLSAIAGKDPPWSHRYLISVLNPNGSVKASKALAHAIRAMALQLDDTPAVLSVAEPIELHARPGTVRPGAVVLAPSRPCINPYCPVHFVPPHPLQTACNPKCRPSYLKRIGKLPADWTTPKP